MTRYRTDQVKLRALDIPRGITRIDRDPFRSRHHALRASYSDVAAETRRERCILPPNFNAIAKVRADRADSSIDRPL
jgi:hypothetical protein